LHDAGYVCDGQEELADRNISERVLTHKSPAEAGLLNFGKWDCLRLGRDDVDEAALLAFVLKLNDAGDLGVESVVRAAADVEAGLVRCATLADENAAARDGFSVAALDAEALCVRVASVLGRA